MRRTLTVAATIAAALIVAGLAPAQTGDVHIDGSGHPNVGALLVARSDGSLDIVCSGTLVSRRVFLTAGHCTDYLLSLGQGTAYVTFDPNFGTDAAHDIFATPYHGTIHQNPNYKKPYHNDTGIVLLDTPVTNIAAATIAPRHFLDGFSSKSWTVSSTRTSATAPRRRSSSRPRGRRSRSTGSGSGRSRASTRSTRRSSTSTRAWRADSPEPATETRVGRHSSIPGPVRS